jgi:cathepsin F
MSKIISTFIILIIEVLITNEAPKSFDWRERAIINYPLKQDAVNKNWANSIITMLESIYALEKGIYIKFSRQMLIDCVYQKSTFIGDQIETALKWIIRNGIAKDEDYPYKGLVSVCRRAEYIDMKVTFYRKLGPNTDEEKMKSILYENGPFIVLINRAPLSSYSSGIIDLNEAKCPSSRVNRALILVGYGNSFGKEYWIVHNTWGKSWGENGYFRIARGKGVCGLNYSPFIVAVKFE